MMCRKDPVSCLHRRQIFVYPRKNEIIGNADAL